MKELASFQHFVERGWICQAPFLKQVLAGRENVNGTINWNAIFDAVPKTCRPNDVMKVERINARALEHIADRPDISLCREFADPGHVDGHDVIVRKPLGAVLDGAA